MVWIILSIPYRWSTRGCPRVLKSDNRKKHSITLLKLWPKNSLADILYGPRFLFGERSICQKSVWLRGPFRLHQCWWGLLEMKYFGDGFAISVTNIHYFSHNTFPSFNKFSVLSQFGAISAGHQHSKDVTKIEILWPTSENCHQL